MAYDSSASNHIDFGAVEKGTMENKIKVKREETLKCGEANLLGNRNIYRLPGRWVHTVEVVPIFKCVLKRLI